MEVALRYSLLTLLTLFTLFTLFTLLTLFTLFTVFTLFILFKLLYTALHCMNSNVNAYIYRREGLIER